MLGLTKHLLASHCRDATLYMQNVCDFSQDDTGIWPHFLLPFGRRIGVIFISPKMTKSVCLKIPSPRLSENIPVHITLNFEDKFSSEAQSHNFNFH